MPEMIEIFYLPEVECDVTKPDALFVTEIVGVPDEHSNRQFLRVGKGFVVRGNGKTYLPIGIVNLDRKHKRALVGSVETLIGEPGSQTRFGNRPAGNSVSRVRQAPAKRSFADKVPKPSLGTRGSTEPP